MTSPVGHSLGAYVFAGKGAHGVIPRQSSRAIILNLAFLVFAGNAPDLDFLPGMVMGDFNAYHHRASHSVFATITFAFVVWAIARNFTQRALGLAVVGGLAYGSHLVLDLLTQDFVAPIGLQLFWPFSQAFYIAPQAIFTKIDHGVIGATAFEAIPSIFSVHNLSAIGLELILLGPLALIVFWRRQHR